MSNTSEILFALRLMSMISGLYLFHLHKSHATYVSGKNCNSIFLYPYPLHSGHAPFAELNEKCPDENHKYFASFAHAYNFLISSKTQINVDGQLLGVFQILV